ncbi:MAG: hypothetical protein BWY74_00307 [Firmicutes bacterium ADurb.Bin419]|nr:MAG: hypothetical protein BWY74_00307 [Firmicutes bacterium ADurb.Bin419]
MKVCIDCGKQEVVERKRCSECAKIHNRLRANAYHAKHGRSFIRIEKCPICHEDMKIWYEGQVAHRKCRVERNLKMVEDYNKVKRTKDGRATIGRRVVEDLGILIPKGWVVHHVDGDPSNNTLANLWMLSLSDHSRLHGRLQRGWSLWLKNQGSNSENCKKAFIAQETTAWLETAGANVLKISEIRQPAAELLRSNEYEEGSETMH